MQYQVLTDVVAAQIPSVMENHDGWHIVSMAPWKSEMAYEWTDGAIYNIQPTVASQEYVTKEWVVPEKYVLVLGKR